MAISNRANNGQNYENQNYNGIGNIVLIYLLI
jgi:hypothetical protein